MNVLIVTDQTYTFNLWNLKELLHVVMMAKEEHVAVSPVPKSSLTEQSLRAGPFKEK